MPKLRTVHRCTECGGASPKWAGRCPSCGEWNSLVEEVEEARAGATLHGMHGDPAMPLLEVEATTFAARSTGVAELDIVLSGGFVPGSATLLAGEPGIGKSTLLLQVLVAMSGAGHRVLLVSAEESPQQVRLRAERLGSIPASLFVAAQTSVPTILATIDELAPDLVVVDSVQSITEPELGSAPGTVAQVRECSHQLVRVAKANGIALVLVGHVTKDGSIAGPRVLEHLVDTVLSFEGDRHHALRLLRAVKHRFGATGELGVFEMAGDGLRAVADPSEMLLGDRRKGVPGSIVVPAIEGRRPLLVEVQALVSPTSLVMPRRSAHGLDQNRLALVLAVLERRAGVNLASSEVYASAVGGVKLSDPGTDLPLALALASASNGVLISDEVVACGEVGLAGEVRQVAHMGRRLAEAARAGFRGAIVPTSAPDAPRGFKLVRVATVAEALAAAGMMV